MRRPDEGREAASSRIEWALAAAAVIFAAAAFAAPMPPPRGHRPFMQPRKHVGGEDKGPGPRGPSSHKPMKAPVGGGTPDGAYNWLYQDPRNYPAHTTDPTAIATSLAQLDGLCASLGYVPSPPAGDAWSGTPDPRWSTCLWRSIGPGNLGGRVTGLAVDPTSDARMFASTVGGLWRTTDGAQTWDRVSDALGAIAFSSVAIAPGDPNLVLAGQGDPNRHLAGLGAQQAGVFVSTTGGGPGTWTHVALTGFTGGWVAKVCIGPGLHPDLFAATLKGVYRGKWSGSDWVWTRLASMTNGCCDLALDASINPPLLYAAVNLGTTARPIGVYSIPTVGTGATWQKLAGTLPGDWGWCALALAPDSPATLYARVANTDNTLDGTFRHRTSGSWQKVDANGVTDDASDYSDYDCSIAVDPHDANVLYVGGIGVWRGVGALGSSVTWTSVNASTEPGYAPAFPHEDKHAFAFLAGSPGTVLLGTDAGIERSTDLGATTHHWECCSHGIVATQFYRVATQQGPAVAVAGGAQDVGSMFTFGNFTWYDPDTSCDAADVALEPSPSTNLLRYCLIAGREDVDFFANPNPVTGTIGGGDALTTAVPDTEIANPPVVTTIPAPASGSTAAAGPALSAAVSGPHPPHLLQTMDGIHWSPLPGASVHRADDVISALAVAPGHGLDRVYMGNRGTATADPSRIRVQKDPSTPWSDCAALPRNLSPNAIAVDPGNWDVAYVALGGAKATAGSLLVTTDAGGSWAEFDGLGSVQAYAAPLVGVVVDPLHPSVIYVASTLAVFKLDGTSGGLRGASWTPLLDGLPRGLDITSLAFNADRRKLVLGTFGYGAWAYDLAASTCKPVALNVRDNVFDDGSTPSPFDVEDPEHPVLDASRSTTAASFYLAHTLPPGRLYWWTSPDIRIERPAFTPPQNQVAFPDNVALESCPTDASTCAPGTNIDAEPGRNEVDDIYVQVTNRGTRAAHAVRVKAMWADATTGTPDLPTNFWTSVFPTSGPCADPDPASGWTGFDQSAVDLPDIPPDASRVATFTWRVPLDAPDHACILALAECPDDPIPARGGNALVTHEIVQANAQIGQRNMHVVDIIAGATSVESADSLSVGNPTADPTPVDIYLSRAGLPDSASFVLVLPADSTLVLKGITRETIAWPAHDLARALAMHADTSAVYRVRDPVASVKGLRVPPHGKRTIGLMFDTRGTIPGGRSARVSVLEKQGVLVLGGSEYVLRVRKP